MRNIKVNTEIIEQLKVVDVRVKMEWKQTGVIENSLLISFHDDTGLPNPDGFIKELEKHIDKNEEFAIICRTGHRTSSIATYLHDLGFRVVNLEGGIMELAKQGYKFVKYNV